jgi:malate synthase
MSHYVNRAGLNVAAVLADFFEMRALDGVGIGADALWAGLANLLATFAPRNKALLAKRETLQLQIDAWHLARAKSPMGAQPHDAAVYQAFLTEIGYLVPEPEPFSIGTTNVDPEVAAMAGPQLVVPALNDRFVLNAANARWGSLYDALYGTDALVGVAPAKAGGYDEARGAAVIAAAKAFLDEVAPFMQGSWSDPLPDNIDDLEAHLIVSQLDGGEQLVGKTDRSVLLRHNGLHIEIVIDRNHPIGKTDPSGIANVILESALTAIVDLEDSIAAVDADDKVAAYANWLGLMRGDLTASFQKGDRTMTRALEEDRHYRSPAQAGARNPHKESDDIGSRFPPSREHGSNATFSLPGRSLLFVRNVGHLMTNPAVLLPDGTEAPEGILDALFTSLCALHDINGLGSHCNSRAGSIYIVKPKMHGPEECAFTNDLFDAVEDVLKLPRHTIKVGVMDEERRTSANLATCIYAVRDRIVFINTGFLDRTGDEMHTSMRAGPMIRKGEMKKADWITAYEARNVQIGLACGLSGKAQIGKGMWAAPDMMADMMAQKIGHPLSGANTAWVPSPTAATLHAMHYHKVDVFARRAELANAPTPGLDKLLTIPTSHSVNWSDTEIREELENNAQGILGYVVRWIDQGIGCSKVPDIHDVGLMEDRATLRISSQHIANWLLHGVCSEAHVDAAFAAMAKKVDAQNAGDPLYRPLTPDSLAFQTARALVFQGITQPSGYTEPLLHKFRAQVKAE